MCDIEPTLKSLGAAPTGKKPNGDGLYTVPTLHDSSTGRVISDSINIAQYLDEVYPDSPVLIPPELKAATYLFDAWWTENIRSKTMPLVILRTFEEMGLEPRTKVWFRETREKLFGSKLEDIAPLGSENRAERWKVVTSNLGKLDEMWSSNTDGKFWFGNKLTYVDLIVVGNLMWARGLVPDEFKTHVGDAYGGRWKDLISVVEQFYDSRV